MSSRKHMSDFDQLMDDIEAAAVAESPAAVAELKAFDTRFTLASELMMLRKQAKMTQTALAAATGVDQAEISRIERGEINPTILTVSRLLQPLGATLSIRAAAGPSAG
jgi:DNA-binding XRE family transcriptional regulator